MKRQILTSIVTFIGLIGLIILAILIMLEIDKHYVEPDWSSVKYYGDCPPGYTQDGGFGCINPLRMGVDGIHNLILYWREILVITVAGALFGMVLEWIAHAQIRH